MDGGFTQQEMERVLARAIELDSAETRATDTATLVRIGAELGIREQAVRRALFEESLPGSAPSLLDRVLGPGRVAAAASAQVPTSAATGAVERFMFRNRLTPATSPGLWLQQRGRWPNPYATNSVPSVQATVRESAEGTSVVMTADLEDARTGFVGACVVTGMAAVLVAVALPGWAALVALVSAVAAVAGIRFAYGHQVEATTGSLKTGLEEIEAFLARRAVPTSGMTSDDPAGVLQQRFGIEDSLRAQAPEI